MLLRARELASHLSLRFPWVAGLVQPRMRAWEVVVVLEDTGEDGQVVERIAALDIGKAEVVCCVRTPDPQGSTRRRQEVRTFSAMTRSLAAMGDWLAGLGVTRVVMEATSDYVRHEGA